MTKRWIFILLFALLPIALLLGGCDVHEFPDEPDIPDAPRPDVEVVVSFKNTEWQPYTTINWNLPSRASRADVHVLRYTLNIFKDDKTSRSATRTPIYTKTLYTEEPINIATVTQTIPIEVSPGKYSAIVWVDYSDANKPEEDLYYDTSDFTFISIIGDDHPGNNNHREGFRGATDFTITEEGLVLDTQSRAEIEKVPVVCERPMARFEFITTDLAEFISRHGITPASDNPADAPQGPGAPPAPNLDDYNIRLRYTSYMPDTYNANTDKPIDSKLGVSFYGKIERQNEHEASLGFDHVFVNHTDATVMVALDVYDSKTGELIASCDPVTVPLKRNHHTIVKGNFLTAQSGGAMGIDPGFDGEFNIEL